MINHTETKKLFLKLKSSKLDIYSKYPGGSNTWIMLYFDPKYDENTLYRFFSRQSRESWVYTQQSDGGYKRERFKGYDQLRVD